MKKVKKITAIPAITSSKKGPQKNKVFLDIVEYENIINEIASLKKKIAEIKLKKAKKQASRKSV